MKTTRGPLLLEDDPTGAFPTRVSALPADLRHDRIVGLSGRWGGCSACAQARRCAADTAARVAPGGVSVPPGPSAPAPPGGTGIAMPVACCRVVEMPMPRQRRRGRRRCPRPPTGCGRSAASPRLSAPRRRPRAWPCRARAGPPPGRSAAGCGTGRAGGVEPGDSVVPAAHSRSAPAPGSIGAPRRTGDRLGETGAAGRDPQQRQRRWWDVHGLPPSSDPTRSSASRGSRDARAAVAALQGCREPPMPRVGLPALRRALWCRLTFARRPAWA